MTQLGPASPFLVVADIDVSVAHYVNRLGFECRFRTDDVFAIVGRDAAQVMLKAVGAEVPPLPNRTRHEWARWDLFVFVADPDALTSEFETRGVSFQTALSDTSDGLRGFETVDPDGYVCFFGRPT